MAQSNQKPKPTSSLLGQRLLSIIGLQTPSGRLVFFGVATMVLFIVPFSWLENLSLWQWLSVPSPSIGLTRAYWLLIHGRPVEAWHFNKLIFLVIAVGVPMLVRDMFVVATRSKALLKRM